MQYIYKIYIPFYTNKTELRKAKIKKITDKIVRIEEGGLAFSCHVNIPVNEAHFTASDAISSKIKEFSQEIADHRNAIDKCQKWIDDLNIMLKEHTNENYRTNLRVD